MGENYRCELNKQNGIDFDNVAMTDKAINFFFYIIFIKKIVDGKEINTNDSGLSKGKIDASQVDHEKNNNNSICDSEQKPNEYRQIDNMEIESQSYILNSISINNS